MYVEVKAPGEAKITKLSEAIRKGAKTVGENRYSWNGCVLGTAAVGLGWDRWDGYFYPASFLVRKGYDSDLLNNIHLRHFNGESRESIAADLDRQGL